jgi:hypothetical protein
MNYAQRKAQAHNRIRSTFGTDETGAQLYVWHAGAQVTAYQSGGTRGRNVLAQILVKDDTLTITATKAEFTTVPVPGAEVKLGTALATARTLRIDSVRTKHGQPWYELELLDPNLATTPE